MRELGARAGERRERRERREEGGQPTAAKAALPATLRALRVDATLLLLNRYEATHHTTPAPPTLPETPDHPAE